MKSPRLLSLAISGAIVVNLASADIIGYWDFNSNDLSRFPSANSSGTMTVDLQPLAIASNVNQLGTGTSLNAQFGQPAGDALQYFSLGVAAETGTMEITGLDFTGMQDIHFSFDLSRDVIGANLQSYEIQYSTNNGGNWVAFSFIGEPAPIYTTLDLDLSSITALNNISTGGLRLQFVELLELVDVVQIDNVTVSATPIPEPSHYALGFGAIVSLAIGLRRRRRS
ncbi:MAG: hypothetical protein AAFX93_12950 [Verrucomicrobiota bacterium]